MNDRKRILIIGADVDLCLLMKVYFLRKNCEVFISHTCIDAIRRMEEIKPHTIFLSSAACQNRKDEIAKISALAPGAEIVIDNYLPSNEA